MSDGSDGAPGPPVNRRGRLLVASPALVDPSFRRAVVLMIEHSESGALGLVLNRPTPLVAREALPARMGEALPPGERVHQGGPVQPDAVILLAEFRRPPEGATMLFERVGVVAPDAETEALRESVGRIRAFGGYAGWGAGQLEGEIAEEAWIDAQVRAEDVFTDAADRLWSRVLERKGGRFRLVARMPEDPSLN